MHDYQEESRVLKTICSGVVDHCIDELKKTQMTLSDNDDIARVTALFTMMRSVIQDTQTVDRYCAARANHELVRRHDNG